MATVSASRLINMAPVPVRAASTETALAEAASIAEAAALADAGMRAGRRRERIGRVPASLGPVLVRRRTGEGVGVIVVGVTVASAGRPCR